ncbi:hypothetical protein Cme02nite_09740 [Catellatospora methionotrophica]|uniref:Uncharacterized protein n=1 Tax=Catellatospora methionotrophica TaxID=121620 RepID=A0A8J3L154_9ACTN|nr:hypothetical protein Cme02nite_09740 [Catellatospora methionotrophica]
MMTDSTVAAWAGASGWPGSRPEPSARAAASAVAAATVRCAARLPGGRRLRDRDTGILSGTEVGALPRPQDSVVTGNRIDVSKWLVVRREPDGDVRA